MRYTKDDVATHTAGYYGPDYPAVNVKAYNWPTCWDIKEKFGCTEKVAEAASKARQEYLATL